MLLNTLSGGLVSVIAAAAIQKTSATPVVERSDIMARGVQSKAFFYDPPHLEPFALAHLVVPRT